MKIIVNVCVEKDGNILMVQENFGNVKGMWNFPAGHLEENEDFFSGAIREAKEETGFNVKLTGILDIQNCVYKDRHIIHIIFKADIIGGKIGFDPKEIMTVEFIDINKILKMTDKELRGAESRKTTIKKLIAGKIYPLELISNFNFENIKTEKTDIDKN